MTNCELAQAMVRLGAVTASALDAGGSTTMAFDGKLLNRPSDRGGERPVAETLAVLYSGVYAPTPALPVVSPNGDGIAEQQQLSYKVVRTSNVTASLVGPGGVTAFTDTGTRDPGHLQLQVAEREQEEAARTGRSHCEEDPRTLVPHAGRRAARALALGRQCDRRPTGRSPRSSAPSG